MIKSTIIDGFGSGQKAKVNPEGTLEIVTHPHPPQGEQQSATPYRGYLTQDNDGTTLSMLVNGSVTNVSFEVQAGRTKDRYIKTLSFLIADASQVLNKFGNIAALANGCELYWETQEDGKVQIHDALKTNFDVIRLCGGKPAFGSAADSFRAPNVSPAPTGAEAYLPMLDCASVFGLTFGLRLRAGTNDKIALVIKDDVSALDQLDVICYGLEI